MSALSIAVIVGSLRRKSFSRSVALGVIERAPDNMDAHIVEIGDLPMFNQDLEDEQPAPWERFRAAIRSADGVLFVTPEYNRSVPGCLKNAIDVGSRPEGKSIWDGKPAGVISVTPYKLGAFGANHVLRQSFVFLNMPAMQQPEAYVSNVEDLLDDNGKLTDQRTGKFLATFMDKFADWVARVG